MKPIFILVSALLIGTASADTGKKIVESITAVKTERSIKISGKTNHLPNGTALKAEVIKLNGKLIGDDIIISSPDSFYVKKDGTFEGDLYKYGSMGGYNFQSGKYTIEVSSAFNRAWQSVEVAKALGVKLDDQGRSDLGEPHALPPASDLVKGVVGVRVLKSIWTVNVSNVDTKFNLFKSKKATLQIIGNGTVEKPDYQVTGNEQIALGAAKKLNSRKSGQALSLICFGQFPGFGYIATDLFYSSGTANKTFDLNNGSTLIELCYQYEESLSKK